MYVDFAMVEWILAACYVVGAFCVVTIVFGFGGCGDEYG